MGSGLVVIIEVLLRITFGLRFLYSGVDNVRRWPGAVVTARVVFAKGRPFWPLSPWPFWSWEPWVWPWASRLELRH